MSQIASVYAKALKKCFMEDGRGEEDFFSCLDELRRLNEVFRSRDVKAFFLYPFFSIEKKKQILKKVFVHFKFSHLGYSFLCLLLDKKRWGERDSILSRLTDMEHEMKGLVSVEVASTEALSIDLKNQLIKKLEKVFKKKISLKEKKRDKELIGGLKIRAGGFVFDDTLLFHLKRMKDQIRSNFYDNTSQ